MAEQPPAILQVYRDVPKPGSVAFYGEIETRIARICRELHCPNPYLAIESTSGPKEVWFFNGFRSEEDRMRVVAEFEKNAPLMEALTEHSAKKAPLVAERFDQLASYRPEPSDGAGWSPGRGRFLCIAVTRSGGGVEKGTVFETVEGTRFVVIPARTGSEAEDLAKSLGPEARVFAVRPEWSHPSQDWIAADPDFWKAAGPDPRPQL